MSVCISTAQARARCRPGFSDPQTVSFSSVWHAWHFLGVCVKHLYRCNPSMTTCNTSKGPRLHSSAVANEATDVWRGFALWSTARTCEPFYFTGNGARLSQEPPIYHILCHARLRQSGTLSTPGRKLVYLNLTLFYLNLATFATCPGLADGFYLNKFLVLMIIYYVSSKNIALYIAEDSLGSDIESCFNLEGFSSQRIRDSAGRECGRTLLYLQKIYSPAPWTYNLSPLFYIVIVSCDYIYIYISIYLSRVFSSFSWLLVFLHIRCIPHHDSIRQVCMSKRATHVGFDRMTWALRGIYLSR